MDPSIAIGCNPWPVERTRVVAARERNLDGFRELSNEWRVERLACDVFEDFMEAGRCDEFKRRRVDVLGDLEQGEVTVVLVSRMKIKT